MDNFIRQEKALQELSKAQADKRFRTNYDFAILYDNILHITAADVRPVVRDTPHMEDAIEAVIEERRRQISLYGDQTGLPLLSWPGILGEEFGELCEAIGETAANNRRHPERGGWDNIYKEACHVAAVAVQIMETVKKLKEEV